MNEFILNNWYYILLSFIAVLGFITSLVLTFKRNKGANVFDSVKAALLENIPFWASISENLATSQDKRNNVLTLGIALVSKLLGRKLSAEENNYFAAFIGENLEKILAAPQKKLLKVENGSKSKYRAQ